MNPVQDLASHWILKLALNGEKKGEFAMYEG